MSRGGGDWRGDEGISFSRDDLTFDLRKTACSLRQGAVKRTIAVVCVVYLVDEMRFDFYWSRYAAVRYRAAKRCPRLPTAVHRGHIDGAAT